MSVKEELVDMDSDNQEAAWQAKDEVDVKPVMLDPPESVYVLLPPKLEPDTAPLAEKSVKEELVDIEDDVLEASWQVKDEVNIEPVVLQLPKSVNMLQTHKLKPSTSPLCGLSSKVSECEAATLLYGLLTRKVETSRSSSCNEPQTIENIDTCEQIQKYDTFQLSSRVDVHTYKDCRSRRGKKSYTCRVCSRTSKSKFKYDIHSRTHTGEKPFSCKLCPSRFISKSLLVRHLLVHTDDRPYSCVHCPRTFKHKSASIDHLRTHTGEKPFECKLCPKKFINKSHLNDHLKVHTNDRPYSCEHCPKTFKRKCFYNIHSRTHQGEKPYTCNECQKKFTTKSDLTKHLIRKYSDKGSYSCKN